ncbi:MAG: ATP-binding protein [Myxococcota bacterium]
MTTDSHLTLVIDTDGRCIHASPRPLLTGVFQTLEVSGQALDAVLDPELRAEVMARVAEARHHGHARHEFSLQSPRRRLIFDFERSGTEVVLRGQVESIPDLFRRGGDNDDPAEILQFVLKNLDHGVLLQGPKAEILMSNDAALRLLGLSEAQLLGSTSFDPRWHVVREDGSDFPGPEHPVPQAIAAKKPIRNVLMGVYRPASNDRVWLQVDAVPDLNADGEVTRVLVSFTDVTEKRLAEEELRREHGLLTQVMATSLAGICVLNPKGDIIFANRAAEKILDLDENVITARSYNDSEWHHTTIEGQPLPESEYPFSQVITTKGPVHNIRFALEWPGGPRKFLSVNGSPIVNHEHEIELVVLTLTDVTVEVAAAQERERVKREMERLSNLESLSILAGGVAHDFNNILVGIQSAADMLVDSIKDEESAEDLEVLQESVARASELTRQLLAYSGKGRFMVGPRNLSQVLQGTTKLLTALVQKGMELEFSITDDLPAVEVDQTQVRQIVMNLVLNASEATVDGDHRKVAVSTGVMEASETESIHSVVPALPGRYAYIEVSDNGCGMDESTVKRIFDPFFTTKLEGQGLGLAAVLGVVRGHNGLIRVDSAPGLGTTIRVGFPLAEHTAQVSEELKTLKTTTSLDCTVLVVDDEVAVQRTLTRQLTSAGAQVLTASDGAEGLSVYQRERERIDAMILDLTMPKLTGDVVLTKLREIAPDLPVLIMSGFSESVIPQNPGPTEFMPKPFRRQALVETLRELLTQPPDPRG